VSNWQQFSSRFRSKPLGKQPAIPKNRVVWQVIGSDKRQKGRWMAEFALQFFDEQDMVGRPGCQGVGVNCRANPGIISRGAGYLNKVVAVGGLPLFFSQIEGNSADLETFVPLKYFKPMHYLLLSGLLLPSLLFGQVLHVGPGQPYANLTQAVNVVQPGDTILMHSGTYAGGLFFNNLKGTAAQWITIKNAPGALPVINGGNNAIQLTDPAYLRLSGLIFQQQTGNGFNTDDGGTYETPAHHVVFDNCIFRDISATGNNDLLKLSGLDSFEIRNCQFINGAAGGSGVDMVGCHYGVIENNYFENLGSNSIQAKGGTAWIRIQGNFFKNGGQRTLNLGGSTGLAFFRPDTVRYEAAHLQVFSNIFVGSWAPIAYVGCVDVQVVNNTFYKPENWVIRILQETVDPDRFLECGDNSFVNNIIYLGHTLNTTTNIGPNTRPQTFLFSNNLWYNNASSNWNGPFLPTPDLNQILNQNPLLADPDTGDFSLMPGSPAIGTGLALMQPTLDFNGKMFLLPRSRGAIESGLVGLPDVTEAAEILVSPNPFEAELTLKWADEWMVSGLQIELYDMQGKAVYTTRSNTGSLRLPRLPSGPYVLLVRELGGGRVWSRMLQRR